jgi:hypothetical protein
MGPVWVRTTHPLPSPPPSGGGDSFEAAAAEREDLRRVPSPSMGEGSGERVSDYSSTTTPVLTERSAASAMRRLRIASDMWSLKSRFSRIAFSR